MRMPLSRIERYATGKSPFVGIPVWDSTVDRLVTAVFLRSLLDAALEFAKAKGATVEYVSKADNVKGTRSHELVFNDTKAGSWRLVDLKQDGKVMPWDIADRHRAWAAGRRKAAITRAKTEELGKDGVYIRRLREAIAKLEKCRDKVKPFRPSNPCLVIGERDMDCTNRHREWESKWRAEKPMRKALAILTGQRIGDIENGFMASARWPYKKVRKPGYKMDTWKEFYGRVEVLLGHPVSDYHRHERVCNLTGGPDRIDYLKQMYKHLAMESRPWRHKADSMGETEIEQYRQYRKEYLDELREVQALQSQIDAHKAEIASALENRVA